MEGEAGPGKRYGRAFAIYAAGAAVEAVDVDMADVIFLDKHPGWSWADLVAAPDEIVLALKLLDTKRQDVAR